MAAAARGPAAGGPGRKGGSGASKSFKRLKVAHSRTMETLRQTMGW